MTDPGKFDDPIKLSQEPEDDETVVEHVHRGDEEFDEHYHLKAYERRKREEEAKRKTQREHAASAERVQQGVLQRHYEPHSKRVAGISLKPRPQDRYDKDLKRKQKTPEQLRNLAVEHETLRKQHMSALRQGRQLLPPQQEKFRRLHEELEQYDYILDTGGARIPELPGETENRLLGEKLEEDFPTAHKVEGLRPENEDIESTVGKHHQESKQPLLKVQHVRDKSPAAKSIRRHIKKTGQPNKKLEKKASKLERPRWEATSPGWSATTRFNSEQLQRKYNALKTGEASLGFGERGVKGHAPGVPVEKAKLTVGPNRETIFKTSDWQMLPSEDTTDAQKATINSLEHKLKKVSQKKTNPLAAGRDATGAEIKLQNTLNRLKAAPPPQDKFEVTLATKPGRRQGFEGDNYVVEGQAINQTLERAGLKDVHVTHHKNNSYTLYTDQGSHLNPDQIAALQEALHTHHGLKQFDTVSKQRWIRKKARVPVGYSKLPKDLDEKDIVPGTKGRNIYSGRFGAKFGERDPVSGDLLPGETNTVGLHVGPRALQYNLDESTDAIGWGTSWRPGSKEISGAVMAVPEARRKRELREAYETSLSGNEDSMDRYLRKYYSNDEQDEREERRKASKAEAATLSSAAFGSAYYTAKRKLPTRAANFTFAHATRLPKVGPKLQNLRGDTGTLFRDVDLGIRRPLSAKIELAKAKAVNPLSSFRYNPETQGYEVDPTVPGITNEGHLNLPRIRYRTLVIGDEELKRREFERRIERLKSNVAARQRVQDILTGKEESGRAKQWLASKQGKSMLWDVYNISNEGLKGQINNLHREVESFLPQKGVRDAKQIHFRIKNADYTLAQTPKLHEYLRTAKGDIKHLLDLPEEYYSRDALDTAVREYATKHPNLLPRVIGTFGKATVVGGAALGAGVLAIDRYQQYKVNKGHDIDHPVVRSLIPERIAVPKVKVKRTMEYTVPHNALTDALDLEGEKIPVAGRISVHKEEKLRLREHKDISGEGYKRNLPILGGLGVHSPATGGSLSKSILTPSSPSGIGPTKNMYVAGKKVPIDISVGRKERWDNKRHKLRARNDPFGLDSKDRERLTALASESPEQEEQIRAFFYGNKRLEDLLDSKDERQRAINKNRYWLKGDTDLTQLEDVKGRTGVAISGQSSRTLEQQQEISRRDRRARKDWKDSARP